MKLVVVTATTNYARAKSCIASWGDVQVVIVANSGRVPPSEQKPPTSTWLIDDDYLGTVPAFRRGVDFALDKTDADIIACLHDDLELQQADWQTRVLRHFEQHPACGLLGFGGAIGLGSDRIYQDPYDPMQLARIGFRSNLVDAEVHGIRSLLPERVACLDGFSQVGRKQFWEGVKRAAYEIGSGAAGERPLTYLEDHGIIHHAYDSLLGCLAARAGWETWYLPIRCRHWGGQTAVGDQGYQDWAKTQIPSGDHGFWMQSHKRGYDLFSDVLPLRV